MAQNSITGRVMDAASGMPIAYANIGITALQTGTVSVQEGRFNLARPGTNERILCSAIGYQTVDTTTEALQDPWLVYLQPVQYALPPVVVEAERFQSEALILGLRNETRGHSIGFGSPQLGAELAAPIQIDRPTLIKSAHFVLNHAKGDSLLMRVHIYALEDGQIGDRILRENIFIREKQRRGTFSVDLSHLNLMLESDVALSLEWLRNFDEVGNKDITFDTKKGKGLTGTYVRPASHHPFERVPYKQKYGPCFYFMGKQTQE